MTAEKQNTKNNTLQEMAPQKQVQDSDANKTQSISHESEPNEETLQDNEHVWGDGLSLEVSSSKMRVSIEVDSEHAQYYSPEEIKRYLEENNIVYGISEKQIRQLFDEHRFNESIVVAKGKPEQHGVDGYVDWDIDLTILDGARLIEQGGRVDWKEQHHVLPVKENQLLARLIAPTEGTNGQDVYGKEIPAKPGKPAKFPAGKGTRISENGDELFADLTGVVCRENEKISVTDVFTNTGDVNFASGNIRSDTTVIVKGGVLSDFIIESQQDVHVDKLVEGATIKAVGNIYLSGGIQGDNKAFISAGGDVVVKFVNNATIEANGNVVVNGPVTNSTIRSKGKVLISGSKAVVMGGKIYAEHVIEASTFGSEMGVKTELNLGIELIRLIELNREDHKKIESLVHNYKKLKQAIDQMNALRDKGKMDPKQHELRLKIIRSGMLLQGQIKKMQEETKLLESQIEKARKLQKGIIATEQFWPGVVVKIMDETFPIKTVTSKAIISKLDKTIEVFGYKEKEESKKDKHKEEHETDKKESKH